MTDNEHDGMKKCTKCGEWKPANAEYFDRNKTKKGGLDSQCKECVREYREKNKEKIAERDRKHYEKNRGKKLEAVRMYQLSPTGRLSDALKYIRKKTGATIYLRDMTDEEKETLANQYVAVITLEKTEKELLAASGKKRCTKCDRILDYGCFNKHNDGYAGLKSYCKNCQLKMDREYKREYHQQKKQKST